MKKYLYFIFTLAMFVSGCVKSEIEDKQIQPISGRVFTASFESENARTYVEEGNLLRWNAGDQISLFDSNTLNRQYQFDGETGDNAGTFSIVNAPFGTGNDLNCHYAVYPYNKDIKITETGVITANLPAEQSYAENSFGLGANTMVAVTQNVDDTFLKFRNVGGYLKLQLYGDNVTVKSITLTGNNNEKLAGKATITPAYEQAPTLAMSDDATTSITLDCGEGVKIGSTKETATAFWIVVPPTTFEEGLTISITDCNGEIFTKSTSNKINIERNTIHPMALLEVTMELVDIPYITFSSEIKQTFTMTKAVESVEYSLNEGKWNELGVEIVTFGGDAGNLRLRGKSLIGTACDKDNYSKIRFGELLGNVTCSGDIRTLVDYENHTSVNTSNARFCCLFSGCYGLIETPNLPATVLADYCYYGMFNTCISLNKAPELPATTLTLGCYMHMFAYCESLICTPLLPAENLAEDCYAFMFRGCTNLNTASDLTATTLANGCYRSMFRTCKSLEIAPNLSATTLAENCCNGMFYSCTNLKKASNLPATTLADGCYSIMFAACKSLTTAPKLPATNLASSCYHLMFTGAGLIEAPDLPATSLAPSCYWSMFRGCESLVVAPNLPATTLASNCYGYMFSECTSLVDAPNLPATTLASDCYGYMFYGCTSLVDAPDLPATTLATNCYRSMYDDCSKLNNITMLATDISAGGCLDNWVSGVASEGVFTKAKDMTTLTNGSSGIPTGWTVIDKD